MGDLPDLFPVRVALLQKCPPCAFPFVPSSNQVVMLKTLLGFNASEKGGFQLRKAGEGLK